MSSAWSGMIRGMTGPVPGTQWSRTGMNLQTFRAPTMAECLADVKRVMGPDAVILHTRTLTLKRFLGLRRREIVEITAGGGAARRAPPAPPPPTAPPPAAGSAPQAP